MRPWRPLVVGAAGILAATLGGCVNHPVGPARTFDDYEGKAVTTAESALSAVETVRLLATISDEGRRVRQLHAVSVSEQEDSLGGVRGTFASIQPPDDRSVEVRNELIADPRQRVRRRRRRAHRAAPRARRRPGRARPAARRGRRGARRVHRGALVKRILGVFLGILTAIGGFVDMGDLVANAETGARFGLNLAWVVVVGVIGIIVYAEMSGRVAAVCRRPVFDLVRERLGPRFGAGQPAGLVLHQPADAHRRDRRRRDRHLARGERQLPAARPVRRLPRVARRAGACRSPRWSGSSGCSGCACSCSSSRCGRSAPTGASCGRQASSPHVPAGETPFTYAYFAIALFGAAMTPYEVFFFSSGAVEDGWTIKDLDENRANVLIGFPLGGLLSLAIMACAHLVLAPRDIGVDQLSQVALPGGCGPRQARAGDRAHRHLRGHVRRRPRDVAVGRLHRGPVPRLAVGQVRHAAPGGALPRGHDGGDRDRDAGRDSAASTRSRSPSTRSCCRPRRCRSRTSRSSSSPTTRATWATSTPTGGSSTRSPSVYLVILVVVAVATIPLMIITKGGA